MQQQQQQSSQTTNQADGPTEQHAPSQQQQQQQQQAHPPDSPGNMFIRSGGGHSRHSSVRSNGSPSPRASSSSSSTISCVSPSAAVSHSHGELILRGSGGGGGGDSSLIAFTGALREMLRTNSVRASRQAAINETNAQMHAMHFMLGYCNAERSMRLQREYESVRAQIEEGRTILAQMGSVIASQDMALASLGSSLTAMEERASETAGRVAGVEDELAAQKAALASAMAEYEQRLAAQEREMRAQEASLARLLSVRFRIDFGLDVLMALLSWYLAHNGLVALVAQYLGQNVLFRSVAGGRRTRNRYTRHTVSAVQIVLFLALLRRMRRFALEQGLHHAIGSYSKYAQFVARMCGSTIEIVRGQGSAALSLRDPADEEDAAVVAHARERERIQAGASEATGGAHTDAASSLHATVLPAVSGVAPDPDFSSSAAVSLGRSVGSALVAGLRSGRDSVRWMLRRVVATGAAEDMEIDSGNSDTAIANSAAANAANAGSASAAHSHPAPQPVQHTPGDVQGARSGTHTPTQSHSQPFHSLPHPQPHHYSASAFHTPSSSHGLDHSFSASPYVSVPGYVPASAPPSFDHTQMLLSHMHAEPLLPPPSILFTPSAPPQHHANADCK